MSWKRSILKWGVFSKQMPLFKIWSYQYNHRKSWMNLLTQKNNASMHCFSLSQPQRQHKATQPQHSSWVGHEYNCANPTHHPPTIETQQQPLWASEQHPLMTTKYSEISNNKQDHKKNNKLRLKLCQAQV